MCVIESICMLANFRWGRFGFDFAVILENCFLNNAVQFLDFFFETYDFRTYVIESMYYACKFLMGPFWFGSIIPWGRSG